MGLIRDMKKILVYADIDLNLIDGSSVWVYSLLKVLEYAKDISVDIILKKPIINDSIISGIENINNVNMINLFKENNCWSKCYKKNINSKDIEKIIIHCDKMNDYDLIIIRGNNTVKNIISKYHINCKLATYIIGFPNSIAEYSIEQVDLLRTLYENSKYVLIQTEEMKELIVDVLSLKSRDKIFVLPPMIADFDINDNLVPQNLNNKLVYEGKFSTEYNILETIQAFIKLKENIPTISLEVLGNKFNYDSRHPEFEYLVRELLDNTPGIKWHGGVKKEEVDNIVKYCDVGISWRKETMNQSKEISTKLLEYGKLGKPVIMNKTELHEKKFGKDYPLFANSFNEFIDKIKLVLLNKEIYTKAAIALFTECYYHTYKYTYDNRIKPILDKIPKKRIKVVFVGYDLKFIKDLIEKFKHSNEFDVMIDKWIDHKHHDVKHSEKCIMWADIIICEWGLGNAVWYSNNKRRNQKLIVRIHRQEFVTSYPNEFNNKNIDSIITICPYRFEEFNYKYKFPREKMKMIYNYVVTEKCDSKKDTDSSFRLGMVGICPKIKRLDRALDIFEKLWNEDKRYKLHIKGKKPKEYKWLWAKTDERKYYNAQFKKIKKSPWKKSVIFDGYSEDIASWYKKVGFLLSTSDYEGSHQAVAESMASGCIPIIIYWNGCETIYPSEYIVSDIKEAKEKIKAINDSGCIESFSIKNVDFSRKKFDIGLIYDKWKEIILDLYR